MNQSIGARLRQQREQQQIPIDVIAAKTKINPTLLEALERDDMSHWPTGIFRRAYIRDYARAIGLDPEPVVREFLEVHPDSVEVLAAGVTRWAEPNPATGPSGPGNRLGRIVTSAISVVPAIFRGPHTGTAVVPEAKAEPGSGYPEPTLSAVAHLCARLGRVVEARDVSAVLAEAAELLDAVGLAVWLPGTSGAVLFAALVHGYAEEVLPRMTSIMADGRTAVATAFRSADLCIVEGNGSTGAVVVPMVGRSECMGVLALELQHGMERLESVRAFATILASQLVTAPLTRPAR